MAQESRQADTIEITPAMVAAAVGALTDSGFLRIGERAELVAVLARDVLFAALAKIQGDRETT